MIKKTNISQYNFGHDGSIALRQTSLISIQSLSIKTFQLKSFVRQVFLMTSGQTTHGMPGVHQKTGKS